MMTIAEQIAEQMDGDGLQFKNAEGMYLDKLLEDAGAEKTQNRRREATRYDLPDGSAIVIAGCAWDFAHPDCDDVCWAGLACICNEED